MPAPFETEKTRQETLDLLLEIRPESTIVCFPALVYGTEWDRNREKYGFSIEDERDFYTKGMTFRVNHLFPPVLWRQFADYNLNGKSLKQIGQETAAFVQALERQGLVTQLFDQTLLIAEYSGMTAREFGQRTHQYLQTGDHISMQALVSDLNRRMLG
jgi:hypothetical protein